MAPERPTVGIAPTLSDAELLTLAVMSALLGYVSERRWLRRVDRDFRGLFPYVPQQSGYNKRIRHAPSLLTRVIRMLARDTTLWSDDVWVVDSTPVGCGCSRETTKRSDPAGWAQYGYCAPHSRFFRGLRLHLVCTLGGLPVLFALTGTKADERETLQDMLHTAPDVVRSHPGQTIIGDKNYFGREFEHDLTERELVLLRPARKGEPERPGVHLFKPLRQVIESINQTFKGQLDLERHGGKSPQGVAVRILTRILALTTAIWHILAVTPSWPLPTRDGTHAPARCITVVQASCPCRPRARSRPGHLPQHPAQDARRPVQDSGLRMSRVGTPTWSSCEGRCARMRTTGVSGQPDGPPGAAAGAQQASAHRFVVCATPDHRPDHEGRNRAMGPTLAGHRVVQTLRSRCQVRLHSHRPSGCSWQATQWLLQLRVTRPARFGAFDCYP